ncbi:MAG: type II toxin-antitoxin system RelE/ParE family toxin [Clostridiales bacterium]|nr:type II toxin-antitoxin system RelE/ParE family toxin [Clostridiales bacterium]
MNLRIDFSPESLNDIEEIKLYLISEFGEKTSTDNIKKVMKSIRNLAQFPLQGTGIWERLGIESDYRYIYINHNYVFYRVEDESVKIIRILDARRDFIKILFGINIQTDDL